MRPYVQNSKSTHCFGWVSLPVAKSLVMQGLLIDIQTVDGGGNPHYAIDLWILAYLRKHPELVGIRPDISN